MAEVAQKNGKVALKLRTIWFIFGRKILHWSFGTLGKTSTTQRILIKLTACVTSANYHRVIQQIFCRKEELKIQTHQEQRTCYIIHYQRRQNQNSERCKNVWSVALSN